MGNVTSMQPAPRSTPEPGESCSPRCSPLLESLANGSTHVKRERDEDKLERPQTDGDRQHRSQVVEGVLM